MNKLVKSWEANANFVNPKKNNDVQLVWQLALSYYLSIGNNQATLTTGIQLSGGNSYHNSLEINFISAITEFRSVLRD